MFCLCGCCIMLSCFVSNRPLCCVSVCTSLKTTSPTTQQLPLSDRLSPWSLRGWWLRMSVSKVSVIWCYLIKNGQFIKLRHRWYAKVWSNGRFTANLCISKDFVRWWRCVLKDLYADHIWDSRIVKLTKKLKKIKQKRVEFSSSRPRKCECVSVGEWAANC